MEKRIRFGAMALVLFLLVGSIFASNASAGQSEENSDAYDVDFLEKAFTELAPFVKINEDYTLTLDAKEAKRAGLHRKVIKVGQEFVELNNELVNVVRSEGIHSKNIDRKKLKKFEAFFKRVAEGKKGKKASSAVNSDLSTEGVDKLTPLTQTACGGGPDDPHVCPSWRESGVYRSTLQGIIDYLTSNGFHATAGYACGGDPFEPCEYDYTKVVSAYGCPGGPFRTQAIIYQSGSDWTYRYQTPEPNPEIFSYWWPAWWWGAYVVWWHQDYC